MISRECANPDCQVVFVPDKYNPDRHEYCGGPECIRYRDNVRQGRHYARHCVEPVWREKLSKRKREERQRRQTMSSETAVSDAGVTAVSDSGCDPPPGLLVSQLLAGMAEFVGGPGDSEAVAARLEQCLERGRELFPDAESAKNSALGSFFLTLAHARSAPLPHVRSP